MEKICLASWRRTGKTTVDPETAAQRRARERESDFELTDEDLAGIIIPNLLSAVGRQTGIQEIPAPITLELNREQSRTLRTLPLTSRALVSGTTSLHCRLVDSPQQENIILRFSDHGEQPPEMMSLRNVSAHLRMSRRSIMRLMQDGKLRHQRVGNQYIFPAEDIRTYRHQRPSESLMTKE